MQLKEVFSLVLESAEDFHAYQLSAAYLTFLRHPSKKYAIIIAENILHLTVEDYSQDEYDVFIGRRVVDAKRNIDNEEYFYQDKLKEAEWFFRESYGIHEFRGFDTRINHTEIINSFIYYLAVMT